MNYVFDFARQTAFNAAYILSLPPQLRVGLGPDRTVVPDQYYGQFGSALTVNGKSYPIDKEIMYLGYDPYETMLTRALYGYPWVVAQGQMLSGSVDLNSVPVGTIPVPQDPNTCDLTVWYPAFDPPAVVVPVVPTPSASPQPFGAQGWSGIYRDPTSGKIFTNGFYGITAYPTNKPGDVWPMPDGRVFICFLINMPMIGSALIWGLQQ